MKRILFLVCLLPSVCFAQSEKIVKASVKKAIVYLQGAQLYSTEMVNLVQGNNYIIFEGVSPFINADGIQVSGRGNFVITETRYEQKYKEAAPKPDAKYARFIELVDDSLEENSFDLVQIQNQFNTLATEKNMLLGSRIIKGEGQKDSLPLLRDGMNFLRERLNNIYNEELRLSRAQKILYKLKAKLDHRRATLVLLQNGQMNSNGAAESVNRVIVSVYSEAAVIGASLTLAYFVQQAGWVPYYELHGEGTGNSIKLKQMASIYQTSQVDWKDAQVTLSTATPGGFEVKPELSNWYLNFFTPQYKSLGNRKPASAPLAGAVATDDAKMREDEVSQRRDKNEEAFDMVDYTATVERMALTEYELKLKYHIPSDGQMHYVSIQSKELPASYYYSVVPKLDLRAYLMARVTGWEELNLVPGRAKIYFDGNLAGTTQLNPQVTSDTLMLNMGKDQALVIQRKKVKEEWKEKIIHDERVRKEGYEITIRNSKSLPIIISIEDQIPVVAPNVANVKVEMKEKSGAQYDEASGKLTWEVKVSPKESKKLTFGFQVTSPKDMLLSGL